MTLTLSNQLVVIQSVSDSVRSPLQYDLDIYNMVQVSSVERSVLHAVLTFTLENRT